METTVDARGLSCPQPVLMTLDELKKTTAAEIVVLVDTEASKENVSRAVESQGWKVLNITEEEDSYRLEIHRG
ncbi:MAG: preprotein translocase subunit TatB [Desulfobacteraceae bacterium]|nr:sulfurtransferase TusA family protein [Desulfobacteraceae bacterium]MBC2755005.1 preprotein translocase subunit TatB [Desulfobacteraceae bacterium]